jgi:hypothetical protein
VREAQWHQWVHAQTEEEKTVCQEGSSSSSPVRSRWKKAGQVALRAAGGGDNIIDRVTEADDGNPSVSTKMMDLAYFLEMVDAKHRYGSNLRVYHNYWKAATSRQNFFEWLDFGEGKDIELSQCPRDRLEREQVRYLTKEERMYYLVNVDEEGRFHWAKNGERVTTSSEQFRDSIHGVVPVDDNTPRFGEHTEGDEISPAPSTASSGNGSDDGSIGHRSFDEARNLKKLTYVSPGEIFYNLMRKSLNKKDEWIFVCIPCPSTLHPKSRKRFNPGHRWPVCCLYDMKQNLSSPSRISTGDQSHY